MPLNGLLDFAVGAASQRLQQLVAVLQVVLVVVLLHAGAAAAKAPPPPVAIGRPISEQGWSAGRRGGLSPGGGVAPGGLGTGRPTGSGGYISGFHSTRGGWAGVCVCGGGVPLQPLNVPNYLLPQGRSSAPSIITLTGLTIVIVINNK